MKHCNSNRLSLFLTAATLACSFWTRPASAQMARGAVRYALDVDVLSAGAVWAKPHGERDVTTRVVSVGPNQLGNSQVVLPNTPVGIAFDYVVRPKWLIGVRTALGYDHRSRDDSPNERALSLSFMPALSFVPRGGPIRPFVKFSPIAQYSQRKQGSAREHIFMGCFSIGGGAFLFSGPSISVDAGAYFEGRFGKLKVADGPGQNAEIDDLRGVVRVGLSLWK
ncbi:MAG: hypothetical protein RL385_2618 [Pseudomonadota bacterium]